MDQRKLVRDRIPERIQSNGHTCSYHIADTDEYWMALKAKLLEEVNEVVAAETDDDLKEELADLLEVIDTLIEIKGMSAGQIHRRKREKGIEVGRFQSRIILDSY